MNKNYTLNGLVDFVNKKWYKTESVIVNLCDEFEIVKFGKLIVNGLHQAIKDYKQDFCVLYNDIEYNKLIKIKHEDLNLIHYKYYIKHYNENYITLATTEINLDKKTHSAFDKTIEEILKNRAWAYYTDLLMREEIIAIHDKPISRTNFEKYIKNWIEDSCYDIWCSKGVEDDMRQYEPELKFIQDEFEENIRKEIEFEKSLVTAYVDFYEDDCIIQEMSVGEFRKFYKGVRNRIDGHLTMLFDEAMKNMTYCTGLRLYKKSDGDLKRVKIKDYL